MLEYLLNLHFYSGVLDFVRKLFNVLKNRTFSIMSNDSVVLSYHDVLLHESDVELLKGPYWLNDTIISFYFEYISREVFGGCDSLLFVTPEVTQCLKMVDGKEFGVFLEPLDFMSKKFVFFAVNDNKSACGAGGSHWSLLIYSKDEHTFYHCDSMVNTNIEEARTLYNNFVTYLGSGNITFVSIKSLQQCNGYDCGIHVLCNVDILAVHVLKKKYLHPSDCPIADYATVRSKRDDLFRLILDLSLE